MINEQIKQNAEAYAIKICEETPIDYSVVSDAYTAGAHSRDEEIKELKEDLESLQEQYDSLFDGFSKRGTKLGELMKENIKLRNPWISVEERLPNPHTPVYAKNNNSIWFFALRTGNRVRPWYNIVERCSTEVTHWMPILELKKGE